MTKEQIMEQLKEWGNANNLSDLDYSAFGDRFRFQGVTKDNRKDRVFYWFTKVGGKLLRMRKILTANEMEYAKEGTSTYLEATAFWEKEFNEGVRKAMIEEGK